MTLQLFGISTEYLECKVWTLYGIRRQRMQEGEVGMVHDNLVTRPLLFSGVLFFSFDVSQAHPLSSRLLLDSQSTKTDGTNK